ncbi:hypothetical protein RJD39_17330 [Vibrio scophthalmi]|uniref:hypothetical protein n=1 Tax=Vibrio scophthalmi TaxID=45658 RepID=UPI003872D49D
MNTRNIHLFHRRINFNSQSKSRKKCEHSLAHSLRIVPSTPSAKTKKLEWDRSLNANNLIWIHGKTFRLNQLNETERKQLLERVVPQPKVASQSKVQTRLRQYRLKVKKAIESETNKGNLAAAQLLQQVLNADTEILPERIKKFETLVMQRKDQRIKMLDKFIQAHNLLHDKAPANNVYVQEGIIKIPHQWNVGTDVIPLQEYIDFTQHFLSKHFPQHEIKLIVGHDDERSANQNTGAHIHYILSGKNRDTGEYDLRKQQIVVVNQYIQKLQIPNMGLFPENGKLTRKQYQDFGRYFQRMLYDFANRHWLKPKGLVAVFSPESEKRSERRQKMNEEAKLPKSERSYNYYTHKLSLVKQELKREVALQEQFSDENRHLQTINCQLKADNQKQHKENIQLNIRSSELAMENDALKRKITQKQAGLAQLEVKYAQVSELLNKISNRTIEILQSAFKQLLYSLHAKDKGARTMSFEFLQRAFKEKENLPEEFSKAIDAAADEIKKPTKGCNRDHNLNRK